MEVAQVIRAAVAEARVFESWQSFQEALQRAIAPLTEEQMTRRLVPGLRSVGEIAEHIVYGRALWLHNVLSEGAAEVAPMLSWDKPDDPPRTAAEVLHGLDLTWRLITPSLTRRAATDDVSDEDVLVLRTIWGLIDHDLPHGGELSLLLGAYGLPAVEL
jgi:uncharacterized damage-inducible protein DinB